MKSCASVWTRSGLPENQPTVDVNELPAGVLSFSMICVPFLRTPWMKKCVPLNSKSAYPCRGTQNFINVRVLKVRLFWAADQTLPIPDIRKTLQVLSCKVYGGDSWTRTNDPIDVNDVLSLCSMFAAKAQDLVVWNRQNPPYSTRVGWLYWWGELLSMTCLIISCRYYSSSY